MGVGMLNVYMVRSCYVGVGIGMREFVCWDGGILICWYFF